MPGRGRLRIPGVYHCMVFSLPDRPICLTAEERAVFGQCVTSALDRYGARCFGYHLSSHEFRAAIEVPEGGVGRVTQYLGSRYTSYANPRHGKAGAIFIAGRRREVLIERERYLPDLVSVCCWRGVRLRTARKPADDAQSCYGAYVGRTKPIVALDKEEFFRLLGRRSNQRAATFAAFVAEGVDPDTAEGLEHGLPSEPLAFGGVGFLRKHQLRLPPPKRFESLAELERGIKIEWNLPRAPPLGVLDHPHAGRIFATFGWQARHDGLATYKTAAAWLGRSSSTLWEDVQRYRRAEEHDEGLFSEATAQRLAAHVRDDEMNEAGDPAV